MTDFRSPASHKAQHPNTVLPPLPPLPPPPPAPPLLTRMPATPAWRDWGYRDLSLLANVGAVDTMWDLMFGGDPLPAVETWAYECSPKLGTRHLGIACPIYCTRPTAYLIYYHHSIEGGDYKSAADYLEALQPL